MRRHFRSLGFSSNSARPRLLATVTRVGKHVGRIGDSIRVLPSTSPSCNRLPSGVNSIPTPLLPVCCSRVGLSRVPSSVELETIFPAPSRHSNVMWLPDQVRFELFLRLSAMRIPGIPFEETSSTVMLAEASSFALDRQAVSWVSPNPRVNMMNECLIFCLLRKLRPSFAGFASC